MADKGGKGGKASSLRSPSSENALKGKDDDSAKSKSGRKVQFSNEGECLKAGKGDKTGSGVKSSVPKEPINYELNTEKELPNGAQCIMDCEAAEILQGIQEQMITLSRDPTIKIPVSFDKGLQYAKSGGRYTNPKSVRQEIDTLKTHGVSDGEICVIANACPETVDEVFALVPSLKPRRRVLREPIKDVVTGLAKLKCATENL